MVAAPYATGAARRHDSAGGRAVYRRQKPPGAFEAQPHAGHCGPGHVASHRAASRRTGSHEVIASSDGARAYVSIYGGGRYHALSVLDLVAQKALPDIDTGALNGPHGLAFRNGKLWFTAEGAKAIARFDPATSTIDWIMGTGQNRTHMLYVTADQKKVYTTNVSSATVTILEQVALPPMGPPPGMRPAEGAPRRAPVNGRPRLDWSETVIPVGKGDEGFDVSPDGSELWTANAQDGSLSIIDLAGRKVAATLDAKIFGSNRLKFTPDGKQVLISSLRDGNLFIYDVASRQELKRVPIGHGAAGILMDPIVSRVFVACSPTTTSPSST